MRWVKKIISIFYEVVDDFKSCLIHLDNLAINSSDKDIKIFLFVVIFIFAISVFRSSSEAQFYLIFLNVLLVSLISYFIFCFSDNFWFLLKKKGVYRWNIKNKKNIQELIKQSKTNTILLEGSDFEEKITSIVKFYSEDYKTHVRRYIIEISIFLLILLFTNPSFFIFNILLFGGMFVYVFLYEMQSANQAFDDIELLITCILRFHNDSPEKCKAFITENEKKEVKELSKLYNIVIK